MKVKRYPVGTVLNGNWNNKLYKIEKRNGNFGFLHAPGMVPGQFDEWDDSEPFFRQVRDAFTVVKKNNPKQTIKALREEVDAKDAEIANLKKRHEERVTEARKNFDSRIRDMNDTISRYVKECDTLRGKHSAEYDRANALSASVSHLKNALTSAANAVKA